MLGLLVAGLNLMINLNPKVTKSIKKNLEIHHQLYKKIRCKAEYLEELIVSSLRSNSFVVDWDPASHDKEKDITVNSSDNIQIKSGTFQKKSNTITISGHRLGRFEGDLKKITEYLNSSLSDTISVFNPNKKSDKHHYTVASISKEILKGLKHDKWEKEKTSYSQTNIHGVQFSLRVSMSWQIWWVIPIKLIKLEEKLLIE